MFSATAARFSGARRSGGSNSRTELSSTKDSRLNFTVRISPSFCGGHVKEEDNRVVDKEGDTIDVQGV